MSFAPLKNMEEKIELIKSTLNKREDSNLNKSATRPFVKGAELLNPKVLVLRHLDPSYTTVKN